MKRLPIINSCLIFLLGFLLLEGILAMFVLQLKHLAASTGVQLFFSAVESVEIWGLYLASALISSYAVSLLYEKYKERAPKFHYTVFCASLILLVIRPAIVVTTHS